MSLRPPSFALRLLPFAVLALLATACGGGSGEVDPATPASAAPALSPVAALGKKIFADPGLSASGKTACATCHDPARAHADNLAVPVGGPTAATPGFRNAPSLRYLDKTPAFFFAADGTPTGGFNRDGRANTLADQAMRPFLAAHEMANAGADDIARKLANASYAADFRTVFGSDVFADSTTAFDRARFALQQYELEDAAAFHPYTSKYDEFLRGRTGLSEAELRGLALFNNPQKGNCAACHPSGRGADGSLPLFTDFTFDTLGVPRNADIPATADPGYYDLGLCGPDRTDLADRTDLCGAFKVPTLRNIAVTAPYFHNGKFATLKQALQFYVRRDTNPEEWYPLKADGSVDKFDDLPAQYQANVNVREVPYERKPGDAPRLSDSEIDDVIAFLNTLTDGYVQ